VCRLPIFAGVALTAVVKALAYRSSVCMPPTDLILCKSPSDVVTDSEVTVGASHGHTRMTDAATSFEFMFSLEGGRDLHATLTGPRRARRSGSLDARS
jgi:hypothetical protein